MEPRLRLVIALALLTTVPAAAEKPQVHAIVSARVVTVSGAVLESATLVLRDGVIQAVGPTVAVPPDARVIDGKGLTLTPGLIDGFSGLGLPAPGGLPGSWSWHVGLLGPSLDATPRGRAWGCRYASLRRFSRSPR